MAYLHSLDPFALQFPEFLAKIGLGGIRWYGLAYLAGFVGGYFAILWKTRKGQTQFKEDMVADFITYGAIGVLAGGRIGYALFYAPELWTTFDGSFPYWGVLKVNEGGMASHGGILGVLMVSWLYSRRHKMSFLHIQDCTVFGGAIGFFFGRIANFINGELYGREASPDFKWAVKFPQEMVLWLQKNNFGKIKELGPTMDALQTIPSPSGPVEVNSKLWSTWIDNYGADPTARERVSDAIESVIYQVQVGNTAVAEALKPVLTPRHASQLYQAVLEGLIVFLALCWIWRKPQKPGVVSGWFATLYCSARIIGEQFRMPDAHIGFQLWGLTRGQWLSIGMLLAAIAWLGYAYTRKAEKI